MAASTQNSAEEHGHATFSLDHDTLLEIFTFCAGMPRDDKDHQTAVDTLRHISQVSSTWRDLILSSPSLWARVLNLDRLWTCSPQWLEEVNRRTKNSRLYIKAEVYWDADDMAARSTFIRSFVGKHWSRIEDLDLTIKIDDVEEARQWLSLIGSPSDVRYLRILSTVQVWELFPLYCRQLEALELSDDSGSLLYIPRIADSPRFPSGPSISFPFLKRLIIKGHWPFSVAGIMTILERVDPAENCLLYFDCTVDASEPSVDLDSIPGLVSLVLSKYLHYAHRYTTSKEYFFVSVVITNKRADLFMSPSNSTSGRDGEFRFALEFADGEDPITYLVRNFIRSFELLKFEQVKELSLLIHHDEDIALAAITQLANTFPAVEDLDIDASTLLESVKIFQRPAGIISFPSLKNITIGLADAMTSKQVAQLPQLLGARPQAQVRRMAENLSEFW